MTKNIWIQIWNYFKLFFFFFFEGEVEGIEMKKLKRLGIIWKQKTK